MKKILSFLLVIILSISIIGCSSSNEESSNSNSEIISSKKIEEICSNPDKFRTQDIELYGRVSTTPKHEGDDTIFGFNALNNNDLTNFIVATKNGTTLNKDDIIYIKGKISGSSNGEILYGRDISLTGIYATDFNKTNDYIKDFAPSIETKNVDKEENKDGYNFGVNKVEFAENETRVYIKVGNKSNKNFRFDPYKVHLIQNNKLIEQSYNFTSNFKELNSEIMPGEVKEVILLYEKTNPKEALAVSYKGDLKGVKEGAELFSTNTNEYELYVDPRDEKHFFYEIK
ncbi:hypothetical protein CLPU_17c00040 [Gottschalkia purinilytica]|uniref:Lipoprotein n=1 Tax=Gottschalkia purinilytica TaxID=1503 RepID=A0A0L0W790_GOTPU|nr:hypothetical protein [Gottschalkia purinilytica]KNF07379.1 hypothetical protein CLPU_17c00040 [Gottschalkia purinilytica]